MYIVSIGKLFHRQSYDLMPQVPNKCLWYSFFIIFLLVFGKLLSATNKFWVGNSQNQPIELLTELSELKSSYGTLSYQVENFKATAGNQQITLSWTNPNPSGQASNFSKVMIRRKNGSKVTGPSDGVEIYSGTGTSYVDTGLSTGTTYHYRAFAMNDQDEPQTAECSILSSPVKLYTWGNIINRHTTKNI